ncbi:MAG: hypothetical protein NE330_23490 [Lentisphaeraceae bacterium]|nr:hypothetical protein [Lentisphaeraceae bacterium]
MDKELKGMKAGWTLGWIGSTLWLVLLSISHLYHGEYLLALTGLSVYASCILYIIKFTPWNFPDTAYWKLLLPLISVNLLAATWATYNSPELQRLLQNKWQLLSLLPIFIPIFIMGSRTWRKALKEHQSYLEILEESEQEEHLTPHL